jgi:hypothetical protein
MSDTVIAPLASHVSAVLISISLGNFNDVFSFVLIFVWFVGLVLGDGELCKLIPASVSHCAMIRGSESRHIF